MGTKIKKLFKKIQLKRTSVLLLVFFLMAFVLIRQLFNLQIIQGENYINEFQTRTTKTRVLKSTRGNIYDKNNKLIASNVLSYSLTFEDNGTYDTTREKNLTLNGVAYKVLKILASNGDSLSNSFHIQLDKDGNYSFDVDEGFTLNRFRADIYGHALIDDLTEDEADATADEMMSYLTGNKGFSIVLYGDNAYTDAELKQYGLPKELTKQEILNIAIMRYELSTNSFQKYMADVYEFYNLGIGDPWPISAANRMGIGDMLDEVVRHFPEDAEMEEEDDRPKIAIVGKPNVGKSSIINRLIGENRVIVSNIAGTTRDAVDTEVVHNGKEYIFIDTAGLRRKNKIKEELERYMIVRTVSAVERADVVVLVIDAEEGVTEQDAKIAGIAHERGKGMIIAVNKWDAIEKNDKTIYRFQEKIRNTLSFMPYAEIIFISALTGQRLPKLFETIDAVIENHALRVATGVLNEIMAEAVALQQPPTDKGKRLRLYYITQVSVKPPTFVIFVNDKELMHFSYTRYIENKIREAFGFRGTPLKFIIRERKENNE